MVYRRTDREMTCYEHEYDFARKEGIEFRFLSQPARVLVEDGRAVGLECLRVELGSPDASGRPSPQPVAGSEFVLSADQIVKAVGQQKPALAALLGLETNKGFIAVDADFQTSIAGVYAIGDCIRSSGAASTVMAVEDGKLAAGAIHQKFAAAPRRGELSMADLRINFAGIKSPNPFWLASAPPTNSGAQIHKAFEAGWGGAVWKTIGAPVLNVSNRYGAWHHGRQRMLAINNVELISDRPIEINLREIAEVKRAWPDRAVIVSAMVDSKPEAWREIVRTH